jgi:hypothetical protein
VEGISIMAEFEKLKKQLNKFLDRAENEAIKDGCPIDKLDIVLETLKRKFLEKKGISLEDYERLESEFENIKDIYINENELLSFAKKVATTGDKRKEEIESKLIEKEQRDAQKVKEINETISKFVESFNNFKDLDFEKKEELLEKINKVKSEIPKIPEIPKHSELDNHPNIIRDLNNFEIKLKEKDKVISQLRKELDNYRGEREEIDEQIVSTLEKLYQKNE